MVMKDIKVDVSSNFDDDNQTEKGKLSRLFGMDNTKKLIFCCLGIFFCYFYYGVLQEKM